MPACVQAHNPFLDQLQEEEEEEEELELYVEELVLELVKGPGGYGMDITESGHVTGTTPGGVAAAAGTLEHDPSARVPPGSPVRIGRLTVRVLCIAQKCPRSTARSRL